MSSHVCPAPGCPREVSNELLACREHWYALPKPLRDALWRAYNDHGRGSPAHSAAVDACLRALEQLAGASSPAPPPALAALDRESLVRMAYAVPEHVPTGLPPAFMLVGAYAPMWGAWTALQRSGPPGAVQGAGWRVEALERAGGGCTLRLEVDFIPARGG